MKDFRYYGVKETHEIWVSDDEFELWGEEKDREEDILSKKNKIEWVIFFSKFIIRRVFLYLWKEIKNLWKKE